ncbi:chloride channel protein [Synechococcus sp. GFB01]|uniref:chloride channel protein n=1 Tax=Synechococcus sp. GFB01 TaxID=1662190 RepID=UPI000AAC6C36|nr:chloride channel protein [Synechococcus sp. GFB01]
MVNASGTEERFPWNLAPLRALAILASVGLGAPLGTESPAAHVGVATGSWLGSAIPALRPLARPLAIGGGAASVSALMGIPLVGSFFMFELAERRRIPLTAPRAAAMLAGGVTGWGVNALFHLNLIRLVVPKIPPAGVLDAVEAIVFIGGAAGALTALTGEAIYWARGWSDRPLARLLIGGGTLLGLALLIGWLATPVAAFGPGGTAIAWAETNETSPARLLGLALLRAGSTTAAVLAGGCGGVFVPFLAIGDLTGRVFAAPFGIPGDLAGAAGAAAGIAGGYRLPLTAVAMVLGGGRPGRRPAHEPGHGGGRRPVGPGHGEGRQCPVVVRAAMDPPERADDVTPPICADRQAGLVPRAGAAGVRQARVIVGPGDRSRVNARPQPANFSRPTWAGVRGPCRRHLWHQPGAVTPRS